MPCLDGWADAVWESGREVRHVGRTRDRLEITTFGRVIHRRFGKPHVVYADDVETDLSRRDFTSTLASN